MIRTFMSRLLLMRRSAVDWLPDKLSRSSRETPRAVLAFACVLLLVGVLLLCMMAIAGYLFLDRGQLFALSPSASGNFDGVLSSWIAILSLIWAGNALRVPAYAELRRRRLSVRRRI